MISDTPQTPQTVIEVPEELLARRIDHVLPLPVGSHVHLDHNYDHPNRRYTLTDDVLALAIDTAGNPWALSSAGGWWRLHRVEQHNPNAVYVVTAPCDPDEHDDDEQL